MSKIIVKRALISVYYKDGIVDFAKELASEGIEILSTGGTYKHLTDNGVTCIKIEDFTGAKEMFGGRVKTLHPLIHGGILSTRNEESNKLGIKTIDLVVVNLYPFGELIKSGETNLDKLIEMIDIGGPTMLRSAAKNYKYVCPVNSPEFYDEIIDKIKKGGISQETSLKMAINVFRNTAFYDSMITRKLQEDNDFFEYNTIPIKLENTLRYGENPHQKAAYYSIQTEEKKQLSKFFTEGKLHGKELSFNNISDSSAALSILSDLPKNSCVVLKHSNPCGTAVRNNTHDSFLAAYEGDKVSIFGGIVAFKGILKRETAEILSKIFLEIIIAQSFENDALEILSKKKNIRLMEYSRWKDNIFNDNVLPQIKRVLGGLLLQDRDTLVPFDEETKCITKIHPTDYQIADMKFGQTIVKHVKSNAIVIVKDKMLLGVGAGQMNRVTAAKIALEWAGKERCNGAVLASDAFFPMDDTVKLAAEYGIKAIIQPGGSIRDQDSINACDKLHISMLVTGKRHFLH